MIFKSIEQYLYRFHFYLQQLFKSFSLVLAIPFTFVINQNKFLLFCDFHLYLLLFSKLFVN